MKTRIQQSFVAVSIGVAAVAVTVVGAPMASATVTHSKTEAGRIASGTTITSFSGTITIPTVTCPETGSQQMTIRVSVSGTGGAGLSVLVLCFNGSVSYNNAAVTLTAYPKSSAVIVNIAAGDVIKYSVVESNGKTVGKLTNVTSGSSGTAVLNSAPTFNSFGAVTSFCCDTGGGNVTPIPSFTPVKFAALKVNGGSIASLSPTEEEMYDGTTLQVKSSTISSAGVFTNTFVHA